MLDFVVAPTLVDFSSPPENSNMVGIPLTPYLVGVLGSLSILCLAITTSDISFEISSSMGPICLHGPHHSAQKSTITGQLLLIFGQSGVDHVNRSDPY